METITDPPNQAVEKSLHETLDKFYMELYKLGEKGDKTIRIFESDEKKNLDNETPSFQLIEPSTQKCLNLDKHVIYDFDTWEMEDSCLIASVVENSYYIHNLDTQTGEMSLIKHEKISLQLAPEKVHSKSNFYSSLKQVNFNDQDAFYILKFAEFFSNEEEDNAELMIIFAGKSGIIFLVHIERDFQLEYLLGHTNEIYDICVPHTNKESQWRNLIFSCSKDTSVYLWNIRTGVQIACFREITQVPADSISISCHSSMKKFAVSHFDGCIKVWEINNKVIEKIKEAQNWKGDSLSFKHADIQKPYCLTRDLHYNTCDYVQFYGDFLLSKDSEGTIVISSLSKLGAHVIYEVSYEVWEPIWFVKCGLDQKLKLLFVGNDNGEVFFWKMNTENIQELAKMALPVQKQIRKVVLTNNCKYIIMTSDDGKLWYSSLDKMPS